MLKEFGLTQSMSWKNNCHDNEVRENFFGRVKVEMFCDEEKTFRNYEDYANAPRCQPHSVTMEKIWLY